MKKQIVVALSAIVLATGCATKEVRELREADMNDLPLAVRDTILQQAPYGDVAKVDRQTYGGRPVYVVTFHDPIANPHLSIAPDGSLLSGGTLVVREPVNRTVVISEPAGAVVVPREMYFEDLPLAVQDAIRIRAPRARIVDIDKELRPAQTVYEVHFDEPNLNPKLHIREDGAFVDY